ncbi:DUF4435 domain-containing protein [Pseudomonas sp. NPDC090203]|uniref:DUF4435 domain-containing protein n=1 Tax=Pseudomonas sp. NPDC090203 TaxID=3364477 RepID=UPI003821AFAF
MSIETLPSWSASASESIGLLYRELQPVEVYVEDSNSEAFYLELLNRMIEGDKKIRKVIPLHGRSHVLKVCTDYTDTSPALFLVDGDLDILMGVRQKGYRNLFQLKRYCIENYLFCSTAARELIVEGSGVVLRDDALSEQEWGDYFGPIQVPLKELFITFAAAREIKPDLKTVSHGLDSVITQKTRAAGPKVDGEKVEALKNAIADACVQEYGEAAWEAALRLVRENSENLPPIDVISGKDYLLPLLTFFIRAKGCGTMSTPSLMFKLAKYCSLEQLGDLSTALNDVRQGRNFLSN